MTEQRGSMAGIRVCLVTLQILFVVILGEQVLRALPITRLQGILLAVLAAMTVSLLVVPRKQLTTPWFIALLSLSDTAVLLHTMQGVPIIEPWITYEFLLLMVAVSYAPTVPSIVFLSGLVAGSYALSLYRLSLLGSDHAFLLPVLLCVTMVYVSKTRIVQAEIERMVETEEQARYKTMTDTLTGLPNRAQFLERVTRSIQCARADRDFQFAVLFIDLDGFKPITTASGIAGFGSPFCRLYSWRMALIIVMILIALLAGGLSLRYLKGRLVESTGQSLALAAVSAADSLNQMLADRLEDKGRDFLLRVIRGAQQLGKLMEDFLALSRAQRMDLPAEEVESEGLVQEVLRRLEGPLKQTGATVNVAKNLPRLLANSTWATQRIYNLIANALKFRREGGSTRHRDRALSTDRNGRCEGRRFRPLLCQWCLFVYPQTGRFG